MKKVIITLLCISATAGALRAQSESAAIKPATPPPPVAPAPPQAPPAAAANAPKTNFNAGVFKFTEETHDYGTVIEGPLAECDFVFTNTGKEPIVISGAHGSCGCTVPTWPHEPIMPGQQSKIHVTYNTQGRQGHINKDVIINSNAVQNPMNLHITGNVMPKPTPVTATIDSK